VPLCQNAKSNKDKKERGKLVIKLLIVETNEKKCCSLKSNSSSCSKINMADLGKPIMFIEVRKIWG
jgi:hypothetical protein